MPLFRVYKDIFLDIKNGSKTIEVRNRLIRGDKAVFLCGREVIRKDIKKVVQFNINDEFMKTNWKKIIPRAENIKEAKQKLLSIFPNNNEFYAYYITDLTNSKRSEK
ncbi:MAG: hypothetical protein ISS95_01500 [Candidatus Aenigmarchaeota archaeon]|nr:hypothetical protein [Candidatus Aenigmarchaeota archaeon]